MKKNNQEPRSTSSCAACKFLKRRCTPKCQFAPYFRSDEQKKFAKVHKVFGASNVSKILNEVPEEQREDTVNSLVYEAEVRLRDPVYGCIGAIASLQSKMVQLQNDLLLARESLANCYALKPPMIINSSNDNNRYENFNLDTWFLDVPGGSSVCLDSFDQFAVQNNDDDQNQFLNNGFSSQSQQFQFP
ncbi:hypothetical protein LIER_40195 [Lithospermum erythrorhizon]|uniref:LOB domain-containing protein n=1 Tax=Lithospermum erythrorhizon TaxID=34254 RepID=A0AAV3QU19_LITER